MTYIIGESRELSIIEIREILKKKPLFVHFDFKILAKKFLKQLTEQEFNLIITSKIIQPIEYNKIRTHVIFFLCKKYKEEIKELSNTREITIVKSLSGKFLDQLDKRLKEEILIEAEIEFQSYKN